MGLTDKQSNIMNLNSTSLFNGVRWSLYDPKNLQTNQKVEQC